MTEETERRTEEQRINSPHGKLELLAATDARFHC